MWLDALKIRWPVHGERTAGGPDADPTIEDAHEAMRVATLLAGWRHSPVPSREQTVQLRAVLAGRIRPESFALASPDLLDAIDIALATGEGVAPCLRRSGLGLGYPRDDVAMSLAWLAAGEGDALAHAWLAAALCRVPEADPARALPLVADHLEAAGLARMSYDAPGLAAMAAGLMVGAVSPAAARSVPDHGAAIVAEAEALAALRLDEGWRERLSAARARAASALGDGTSRVSDDDLDFLTGSDDFPVPPPPPTRIAPGGPALQVAPGFVANQPHLRPYARLEGELPLAAARDPAGLEAALLAELPWLDGPARHVARSQVLRARGSAPWFGFRPILLVGRHGLGKTRFARALASAAGVPLTVFNAAGQSGAIEILGHSPSYREAHPSAPVAAMARLGIANPLLLIDELDKFGSSDWNGSPHDALLPMLEAETARVFRDEFLRQEVDVSQVAFLLTANELDGIPGPLLDRVDVFKVPPPTPEQLESVLASLVAETAAEFGLSPDEAPPLDPGFVAGLGRLFERGASIRKVRRAVRAALLSGAGYAPH